MTRNCTTLKVRKCTLPIFLFCSAAMKINPVEQLEKDREDQERKLKKMEKEMEQVFEMKVKEKMKKLKDAEGEVTFYLILFYQVFS